MATITFNSNTIGFTKGVGGYGNIAAVFTSAEMSASKMVDSLNSLKKSLDVASVFTNVDTAIQHTDNANYREKEKKSAISLAYRKMEQLFEDVGKVDNETAGIITKLKKDFYNKYKYLKPECEKGYWDKLYDLGTKLWKGICDINEAIKMEVCEWVKDHWKELLIGFIFIVVGALIAVFTAGTGASLWAVFGAALLEGLAKAMISGLITGAISGGFTSVGVLLSGGSVSNAFSRTRKAFGDGFASGFETGGLGFFGQSLGCLAKTYKLVKTIHTVATVSDKLSTGTDILECGSKIVNSVAPNSWLANALESVTENPVYNKISEVIEFVSTISGGADKTVVVSEYDGKPSQYLEEGIAVKEKNSSNILTMDKDGKIYYKHEILYRHNGSTIIEMKEIKSEVGKNLVDLFTGNNKYVPSPSSNNVQINIGGISIPKIDISSINTFVLSL